LSQGFTDWTNLGILPLQDTEEGVPIGMRMAIVGGRVHLRPDAGDNGAASLTEYAKEDGLGTLGDVHPWLFWQVKEREKRAMGSWSMAWGALVTDSASAYYGGFAGVQPLTRNGRSMVNDTRYRVIEPAWQSALPWQPEGMLAMVMPSTDEKEPSSVMLSGDRRLVAAGASGPGQAGTTIVDMQPDGVLCMGGSASPGDGGRHARLQALVRVIALNDGSAGRLGGSGLNSIALNYGLSQQDGIVGYGMIYGPGVSGGGGGEEGPSTGGSGTTGEGPITGQSGPIRPGSPNAPGTPGGPSGAQPPPPRNGPDFAGPGGGSLNAGGPEGPNASDETTVADFGTFQSKAQPGYAIGFMSAVASGPIVFGCGKHVVGIDKDGHRMTSAHLSTESYFFNSGSRDGPLMFEGKFPDSPAEHSIPTLVHLSWDEKQNHNFLGGTRAGKWRWWTTVPYLESEEEEEEGTNTPPPGSKGEPSGPSTPGVPAGPTTPGGGRPSGPGAPNAPATPGAPTGPNAPASTPRGPIRPGAPTRPPRGPIRPGPAAGASPRGPIRPGGPPKTTSPKGPIRPGSPLRPPSGPIRPGPGPNAPETPWITGEYDVNQRPSTNYPVPAGASALSGRGTNYNTTGLEPIADTIQEQRGPAGVVNQVGGSAQGRDVGLYSIFHPFNTAFSAISLRPQLWVKGAPNFEHNPFLGARAYRGEERTRPSVLTIRAWGAQNQSGEWDYIQPPSTSRARGGVVNGGLLIAPAEFEMEDYLGINSNADTDSPSSETYVTFAPKVVAVFGTPMTQGRPSLSSKLIHQDAAGGALLFSAVVNTEAGAIGGETDAIAKMSVVASQGYLELEGTGAMNLPVGTTAQQPSSPSEGDFRYNSSDSAIEYYDGSAWVQPGGGSANQDKAPPIQLTQGPGNYTTERTLAKWKPRAGDITDAELNVSRGITADANRYWIFRIYRDGSVVATISTDTTTISANTLVSFGTLSNESYDGSQTLSLTVQSVNDGTQPISLNGHYLTFDIKMGVD